MRHLCRAVTLIILGAALAACSRQAPPDSPAAGEAATAAESAAVMPPFHYEDVGGELAGFDVALLRAMAAEAGCELQFERDSWGALLGKLREGRLDLLTGATSTEERQEFALFSAPIRREEFALYVRAGEVSAWRADSPGDLMEQGFRLGVIDAYVYDDVIESILAAPDYMEQVAYAHFGEALGGMLLDGEIDGFVENVYAAASIIRRLGLSESITRHPLRLGEGTDVHIMYSKASVSPKQVAQLDAALQRLKDSGSYEALRVQYLE